MEAHKGNGPDLMKMLHMILPYMDPSTKRMLSIMVKVQELKELMAVPESERPRQEEEEKEEPKAAPGEGPEEEPDLAARLQEGLTPEQKNMLTSLNGMLG